VTPVYRILRRSFAKSPLDGEGGYRFGGRWSSPGTRLAYTSEHLSLAMLEYFVHLDPGDPPKDLVVVTAEIPDGISRVRLAARELPANWRQTPAPPALARFGDDFVRRRSAAILIAPSVLAPTGSSIPAIRSSGGSVWASSNRSATTRELWGPKIDVRYFPA
jgi:RES domain-containing protein